MGKALAGLGLALLVSGCASIAGTESANAGPVDGCIKADHLNDYRDFKERLKRHGLGSIAPCGPGVDAEVPFEIERYAADDGEFKIEITTPLGRSKKAWPFYGRRLKGETADQTAHRIIKEIKDNSKMFQVALNGNEAY